MNHASFFIIYAKIFGHVHSRFDQTECFLFRLLKFAEKFTSGQVANQIRLLAAILTFGFKQQSTSLASAREL